MRKQARHDDVVVAAQHARDVPGGLTLADLDGVGVQVHRVATQAEKALCMCGVLGVCVCVLGGVRVLLGEARDAAGLALLGGRIATWKKTALLDAQLPSLLLLQVGFAAVPGWRTDSCGQLRLAAMPAAPGNLPQVEYRATTPWQLAVQQPSSSCCSCCLTVSKDTRVRADGFVKIMAMLMSLKGLKVASRTFRRAFASSARASMSRISSLLKSSRCRKCLPCFGGDTVLPV